MMVMLDGSWILLWFVVRPVYLVPDTYALSMHFLWNNG